MVDVEIRHTPVVAAAVLLAAVLLIVAYVAGQLLSSFTSALQSIGIYGYGATIRSLVELGVVAGLVALAFVIFAMAYSTIRSEEEG